MLTFHCLVFTAGLISLSLGVGLVFKAKIHADKGTIIIRIFGNLIVILSLLVLLCSLYSGSQVSYFSDRNQLFDKLLNENRDLISIIRHDNNMHEMMMRNMMMHKMKTLEPQPALTVPTQAMPMQQGEPQLAPAAVNPMPEMMMNTNSNNMSSQTSSAKR